MESITSELFSETEKRVVSSLEEDVRDDPSSIIDRKRDDEFGPVSGAQLDPRFSIEETIPV